jgi:hypothetical protein
MMFASSRNTIVEFDFSATNQRHWATLDVLYCVLFVIWKRVDLAIERQLGTTV